MAAASVPVPSASNILHAMMLTLQFTPTTPTLLWPTAPIVPATWVPWLWSSIGSELPLMGAIPWQSSTNPLPSLSTPFALQSSSLRHTLAARSWWL